MLDFFIEGGAVMWPVLAIGLVLLGTAWRYARDRRSERLPFIGATALLLVVAAANGMLLAVSQVFWYLSDRGRAPDTELVRTLFVGLKESTRPGVLGGALLTLALVLVAIGTYAARRRAMAET